MQSFIVLSTSCSVVCNDNKFVESKFVLVTECV